MISTYVVFLISGAVGIAGRGGLCFCKDINNTNMYKHTVKNFIAFTVEY